MPVYDASSETGFQSTLPVRGATVWMPSSLASWEKGFQSTLPVRGATLSWIALACWTSISIHAPREGSDGAADASSTRCTAISIHAPREGSDPCLPARD